MTRTNFPQFARRMNELAEATGVELEDVMLWQMALLGKDLIKRTGGNPDDSLRTQKTDMMVDVRIDMSRIFQPIQQPVIDAWEERFRKEGGKSIMQAMHGPPVKIYEGQVGSDDMSEWHKKHRGKTKGRAYMHAWAKKYAWGGKKLVTAKQLKSYTEYVQTRLGMLKAGWLQSTRQFAEKSKYFKTELAPDWITKHAGRVPNASASMQYNKTTLEGNWSIANNVKHATPFGFGMAAAIHNRYRDLTQGYAFKRLAGMLAEQNRKEP